MTGHVFMSYSRRDETAMRRIVTHLRNSGIKVWVDNEKLVPGTPIWEVEIEKAIKNADAVIVVLSPYAKSSEWVRREITYADQYHKRVFPILISGNEDTSIPLRLITRQFVDLRQNEEVGLNSLSKAILQYIEGLILKENKEKEKDNTRDSQPVYLSSFAEKMKNLPSIARLISEIGPIITSETERSKTNRVIIFAFGSLFVIAVLTLIVSILILLTQNIVMLFWIALIIFGTIGLIRGWAKETLVASSVLLGLVLIHILRKYIPIIATYSDDDVSLFWMRTLILLFLIFIGYRAKNMNLRRITKSYPSRFRNIFFSIISGVINGYLIVGSLLFFYHVAEYPFWHIIPYPVDPNLLKAVNILMHYMPPVVLGEPGIYFALIIAFIFVLITLI